MECVFVTSDTRDNSKRVQACNFSISPTNFWHYAHVWGSRVLQSGQGGGIPYSVLIVYTGSLGLRIRKMDVYYITCTVRKNKSTKLKVEGPSANSGTNKVVPSPRLPPPGTGPPPAPSHDVGTPKACKCIACAPCGCLWLAGVYQNLMLLLPSSRNRCFVSHPNPSVSDAGWQALTSWFQFTRTQKTRNSCKGLLQTCYRVKAVQLNLQKLKCPDFRSFEKILLKSIFPLFGIPSKQHCIRSSFRCRLLCC